MRLDLTGAILIDFNLANCIVSAALFGGTTFSGGALFDEATFSGSAWFGGATFSGSAQFGEATFSGAVTSFDKALVKSPDLRHVWPVGWQIHRGETGQATITRT